MPNLSGLEEFYNHRSIDLETRVRAVEDYLARLTGRNPKVADQSPTTSPVSNTTVNGSSGSGNNSGSGQIFESRITFDTYGGHDHDGSNSRLVPLAGDVTGDVQNSVVAQIEGKPIPVPGVGDDLKYIRYNNGGNTFEYAAATSGAPLIVPQVTKTGNYTVTGSDTVIWADATGGAITITLLTAVGNSGKVVVVKKIDNVNAVTIATTGGQTIDGAATVVIGIQFTSYTIVSNGTNWYVV